MQETITNLIVRDPAITAAIRDIKQQIKDLSVAQRKNHDDFRIAQREWGKLTYVERVGDKVWPPMRKNSSRIITSLLIIYGKLRETKHPHFNEMAWKNYFYGEKPVTSTHYYRRQEYNSQLEWLEVKYPTAFAKIGKETF